MAIEKERKFLFNEKGLKATLSDWIPTPIRQGYLMLATGQQLRIRLLPGKYQAFLCYKVDKDSITRHEYEYEIPYDEGLELYEGSKYIVEKVRYSTLFKGNNVDIDIYPGGLKVVEVEFDEELTEIPPYCGKEVTGEIEYTNIYIAMNT